MKLSGIVIIAHVLLLATLVYFHPPQLKPVRHQPVTVNTYIVQEEKPKIKKPPIAAKPKPVVKKPEPATTETKPTLSKPKPKPKPAAKTKEAPKENPNREKLAQMMQQTLSSLNQSSSKTPSSSLPKAIGPLASEALNFEAAYQDRLIAFLETALTLPEKGDVKLTLTVNRNGTVKKASVKETTSERNRKYVESSLPSLLLPSFENNFKGENAHTFSITLTSS